MAGCVAFSSSCWVPFGDGILESEIMMKVLQFYSDIETEVQLAIYMQNTNSTITMTGYMAVRAFRTDRATFWNNMNDSISLV